MNLTIENIILIASLLLFVAIIAGKTSYKLGVPTLILFLAIGMLAGSDGIGGIRFDNPESAQFIGIISLNFILFSGGLDTNWTSIKPIMWQGFSLSTLGVLLTAFFLGIFTWLVTELTIYESLLLGSIVSSTDAAAVFSILRSKSLALKSNIRPTLEFESGSNDPMAYVLTIAFLSLVVNQDQSVASIIPVFFYQMILGAIAGFGFGKLSKYVINKIKLDFEGLYPVLVIALMYITFSVTDLVSGNGFLAVYLCALYLGNQELIHKKTILKMYDGLAWLMQIILFLTLGLLVNPNEMIPLIGIGLLISFFLMIVARPLSVFIGLMPFKMEMKRRLYISWVGLKGAVPIVFATYPLVAGIENAGIIFNIVFIISLVSLLVQGTTLSLVAKWLNLALPETAEKTNLVDMILEDEPKAIIRRVNISESCSFTGKEIVDLNFPKSAIIVMVKRNGKYIVPKGSTVIELNDTLIILCDTQNVFDEIVANM